VDSLDLELRRGEILGLLGLNGAGKTTVMRMITGDLAPSTGRLEILGADLADQPLVAKSHLGYLPEVPPLFRDMRVDEFLDHCARLHRVPRRSRPVALSAAKGRCGLQGTGRKLIRFLSLGYRQRVGIAQAILHRPAVIVLDEPTSGLDPLQNSEIRELIRDLGRNSGVILSTHLLPEVQSICQRVLILHRGRRVYNGELAPGAGDRSHASLRLGLESPPEDSRLLGLSGVTELERVGDGVYRLGIAPGTDLGELACRVCTAGWGLRELTPERRSLERIFVDLVTGNREQ
jgi:ABC-2 type transport system ATP-binding protein